MMPAAFSRNVFLSPAQQKLMAQRITIYSYHKISQPPERTTDPFLYTTQQEFDRQLSALNATGCKAMPLDRAFGNDTIGKAVVITFDDAFRNVLDHGLEILARHKVPAIQFVVSGSVGKENHWDVEKGDVAEPLMDVAQIKQWLAAGNEIGSHSVTHRNLKKLNATEAREEIFASKKFLEDTFGLEVRHFCYPFGGWTPEVRELVIQAGYKTACTMDFGTNGPDADRFALRRIIPFSGKDFTRKIFHRLRRKVGAR
jgi:peptidoglycan/xylan/chitin deacetylase (PgdA/CDA1 family)